MTKHSNTTFYEPLDRLALLVGRAAIQWNNVQFWVYIIFKTLLLNAHDISHALFFSLRSDAGQRDLTEALAKVQLAHDPELLAELRRLLAVANKAAGRRNDVLHAMWNLDTETEKPIVMLPQHHRLRDAEIEQVLEDMTGDFMELEQAFQFFSDRLDVSMEKKSKQDVWKAIKPALAAFVPPPEPDPNLAGGKVQELPKAPRHRRKPSQG